MPIQSKQFPWRIFYRVAIVQTLLVVVAILVSGIAARHFYKKYFVRQVQSQLKDSLLLLSGGVTGQPDSNWCNRFAMNSQFRFTVLTVEGKRICTTEMHPDSTSFLDKPDVQGALSSHEAIAFSSHVENETFFSSLYLPAQKVILRGNIPLERLTLATQVFDTSLGFFLLVSAIGLILIAVWTARRLVFPIGRLLVKTQSLVNAQAFGGREDFEEEPFGEWSDLESNIDSLRKNLEHTTQTLSLEQIELDTVMGAISDAILAVDSEGVPLFYNSRFEMVFGGGTLRRNIKLFEIFRDPEILGAYKRALKEGKLAGTKVFQYESAGEKRHFTLAVSPLRKEAGIVYGALGIFHDISELKSAEQMRIDFVANVSHELRTPLTAIKGYAETMKEDAEKTPDKFDVTTAKDYLAVITRNTTRLMNLMEDLLDLSALESTTLLQRETLSTDDMSTKVLKQLQPKINQKKQSLTIFSEAKTVIADANRLEQVLINLLDNAHKYTPEGGRLEIRWEPDRKGSKDVFLKVTDSGPGIAVEHHARLFERFYRIDKARSREQGGTGLGLAIVKHIMQRHEGAVWAESELGKGSTFVCRFPG